MIISAIFIDTLSSLAISAVFVAGKRLYKIQPPEGNVMLDVAKCIGVS